MFFRTSPNRESFFWCDSQNGQDPRPYMCWSRSCSLHLRLATCVSKSRWVLIGDLDALRAFPSAACQVLYLGSVKHRTPPMCLASFLGFVARMLRQYAASGLYLGVRFKRTWNLLASCWFPPKMRSKGGVTRCYLTHFWKPVTLTTCF